MLVMISIGTRNEKDLENDDIVHALHIECNKEFFQIGNVIWSDAYATTAKVFPAQLGPFSSTTQADMAGLL